MASEAEVLLVVSDVDGTLLNDHKQLTHASLDAVQALREAGVRFTIISARPPHGVLWLIHALQVTEPLAAFNGGAIVSPELKILKETTLLESDARRAASLIRAQGLDLWIFAGTDWYVSNLEGYRVVEHATDVAMTPKPITSDDVLKKAAKLVGVSADFAKVLACETELRACCSKSISASRSQPRYLDVTHADANKGNAVRDLAQLIGVPLGKVATLGDMPTDALMFHVSGISFAMGNADDAVKAQATHVTTSNANEGFALALREILASIQGNLKQGV